MKNTLKASSDLVPAEVSNLTLTERERFYLAASRADRTRQSYGRAWAQFQAWCEARGEQAPRFTRYLGHLDCRPGGRHHGR
jgi:hypothetical protein